MNDDIDSLRERLSDTEAERDVAKESLEILETLVSAAHHALEGAGIERTRFGGRSRDIEDHVGAAVSEIEDLRERVTDLESVVEDRDMTISDREDEIRNLRSEISSLQDENGDLQSKIDSHES